MSTITINVNDKLNEQFRMLVKQKIGEGKGMIGKAIEEAITLWIHEKTQSEIADEMMKMMEEGFEMGKIKINHRRELYDR